MVDLSHVSDQTMLDSIALSRAPIMFSHSNARGLCDHPRNVPDEVLDLIGSEEGKNGGVVQVVFVPKFTDEDEDKATLERVADHIEYIGRKCGRAHVGISSDFGESKSKSLILSISRMM
jgi:membrane dipeptidase